VSEKGVRQLNTAAVVLGIVGSASALVSPIVAARAAETAARAVHEEQTRQVQRVISDHEARLRALESIDARLARIETRLDSLDRRKGP
jgi:hypothetical protein